MIVKTLWGEEIQQSKVCKTCGVDKLLCEFEARGDLSYVRGTCKKCQKQQMKIVEKLKKIHPYPINGFCKICGDSEEKAKGKGGSKSKAFCIDHDHKTGKFRGWLCHDCNRSLGQMGDSPRILRNAANYLESHDEQSSL